MGNFVTVPYLGVSMPSKNDIRAYGAYVGTGSVREYMAVFGSNPDVSVPVIAAALYGSSGTNRVVFALNSGFAIAATARDGSYPISVQYGMSGVYYSTPEQWLFPDGTYEPFDTLDDAAQGFISSLRPEGYRNISYSFQNGIIIGPSFAPIGSQVTAYLTGNPGASVTNESISIMRNGSPIEFDYSNGVLTFTVQ